MHGAYIAGTIAATRRGRQRKLAHGDYPAPNIAYTTIHDTFGIIENAQSGGLTGQPTCIFFCIAVFDAHKYQHSGIYGRHCPVSFDTYGRLTHSLYDYSHFGLMFWQGAYYVRSRHRRHNSTNRSTPSRTPCSPGSLKPPSLLVHKSDVVHPEGQVMVPTYASPLLAENITMMCVGLASGSQPISLTGTILPLEFLA